MPLSQLNQYAETFFWAIGVIFLGGMLYNTVYSNASTLEKQQQELLLQNQAIIQNEKDIVLLQMNVTRQEKWQEGFLVTFKELVTEIKQTNEEVIRNTTKLDQIHIQLQQQKSILKQKQQ